MPTDVEFGMDDAKRRRAISAYYALCTMMDGHVGAICATLEETGLAETTSVIYTSDHGEALGERSHWGKSNLYGECTQVPLVMAGPAVAAGATCDTPVNLIDLAPTFLSAFGLAETGLRGRSLFEIAGAPPDPARASFSEYHAVGAPSGAFMLRKGRWKYHEYVGYGFELFDLASDPDERINRADDPSCSEIVAALRGELRCIVDPVAADRQAKADQRAATRPPPADRHDTTRPRADHKLLIVPHRTLDAGGNRSRRSTVTPRDFAPLHTAAATSPQRRHPTRAAAESNRGAALRD